MTEKIRKFLMESNAIEGVYDASSLMQAEEAWKFLISQKELNVSNICKLHKILMLNQSLMPHEKGYLRTIPVFVGGREMMEYEVVPLHLKVLSENINSSPESWRAHHIEYEMIHPFVDGNGRTGRMIMNWERLRAGESILVIQAGGEEQKDYYKWFN